MQRVPGRLAYPAGKVRGIERWKLERNIPRGVLSCFHLPYTNHNGFKSFSLSLYIRDSRSLKDPRFCKSKSFNLKMTLVLYIYLEILAVYVILSGLEAKSLLTDEDVWFFCDLSLKFIPPINIWKICIDLRLFSKKNCVPFLRPLRSKDDR